MFKQLVSKIFVTKGGVDVAVSDTDKLPVEDLDLLGQFSSDFSRILEKRFKDNEEVRYDIPATIPSNSIYIGTATDGSLTSDAIWTVVRFYFNAAGNPTRTRIRKNVVWDNRTLGW